MPRARTHDPDETTRRATLCFWELGYEGATIRHLEEATGLNRRQLFRDFDSKLTLFEHSLEAFAGIAAERYLESLESPDASLEDIRATFAGIVRQSESPYGKWGCLICNTSRDAAAMAHSNIVSLIDGHFTRIEKAYRHALRRAVAQGQSKLDPSSIRAAARNLLTVQVGMLLLVRAGRKRAFLRDVAEQALISIS